MVSKKSKKKKKKKKKISFFNREKQTWYWEKRWLFSIGNGAKIQPLEKGRKSPGVLRPQNNHLIETVLLSTHNICFKKEEK